MKFGSKFTDLIQENALKMSSAQWRLFCLGLNVIYEQYQTISETTMTKRVPRVYFVEYTICVLF